MTSIMTYQVAHDRIFAPKLRARHLRTFGFRADRVGDTPYSSQYFKVTNISAEVGGFVGTAYAVNNDGRIAYVDTSAVDTAYIVNNGGTFGKLAAPSHEETTSLDAYALNENGEVVGRYQVSDNAANIAWTLTGARGSAIAYLGASDSFGFGETSVNNRDVAVGNAQTSSFSDAEAIEGLSRPPGKVIGLKGLDASSCASANAINDAGEIVGYSCYRGTTIAVRLSSTGYAQPLPVTPHGIYSVPYAINQRGDVAGEVGFAPTGGAFLLRDGKTIHLPRPKGYDRYTSFTAYGVNASDEVVGDVCDSSGLCAGFLYVNGRSYDLNTLLPPNSGWQIVDALGINDHGEIVGDGYYNGWLRGISLKPPI
jgi:uncharacterized membrane protein